MRTILTAFLLIAFAGLETRAEPRYEIVAKLHKKLESVEFLNEILPKVDDDTPLNVSISVTPLETYFPDDEDNENHSTLTLSTWIVVGYTDRRLRWNSADYSGIRQTRIPLNKIYAPDLFLYNTQRDEHGGKLLIDENFPAVLSNDGSVIVVHPRIMHLSCPLKQRGERRQQCVFKIGSWTHSTVDVNLQVKSDHLDLTDYVQHRKWRLVDTKAEHIEKVYPCCPEKYGSMSVTLTYERHDD